MDPENTFKAVAWGIIEIPLMPRKNVRTDILRAVRTHCEALGWSIRYWGWGGDQREQFFVSREGYMEHIGTLRRCCRHILELTLEGNNDDRT